MVIHSTWPLYGVRPTTASFVQKEFYKLMLAVTIIVSKKIKRKVCNKFF